MKRCFFVFVDQGKITVSHHQITGAKCMNVLMLMCFEI